MYPKIEAPGTWPNLAVAQIFRNAISSVNWVGVAQGDGQTNFELQFAEVGATNGAHRLFPGRNFPNDGSDATHHDDPHNDVKIRVTVERPYPDWTTAAERTISLKVFDPDNPLTNVYGTPEDNLGDWNDTLIAPRVPLDNYGAIGISPQTVDLTFAAGETEGFLDLEITTGHPGDNFIAAANHNAATLLNAWCDPLGCTGFRWDRLYYFQTEQQSGGSGTIQVPHPVPTTHDTTILEIWQALWVEADNMAPAEGVPDPPSSDPNDPWYEDVYRDCTDPQWDLASALFEDACVKLCAWNEGTPDQELTFAHYSDADSNGQFDVDVRADALSKRNAAKSADFWHVQLIGAYEGSPVCDGDLEPSSRLGGYELVGDGGPVLVFQEEVRDCIEAQAGWQESDKHLLDKQIVAHEILHGFVGAHVGEPVRPSGYPANDGIMKGYTALAILRAGVSSITGGQLRAIQQNGFR